MDKEIMVVDSQRLNTIQSCAYKYDLAFNHDYIPVLKEEFFERGILMHMILEHYYKGVKSGGFTRPLLIKESIATGEAAAVDMNIQSEEVEEVNRVALEYFEFYQDEKFEVLEVERVGSKVLYEDNNLVILYETKIDLIVRIQNVEVLPVDHKTYSKRGPISTLSNQFLGYCWMLNVRNLMINRIGLQKTIAPKEKFLRPITSYALPVIESWVRNTTWWCLQLHKFEQDGTWPQNFTSCDKYAGCIFQQVCACPEETRDWKLSQMFEKREEPWDVGKEIK